MGQPMRRSLCLQPQRSRAPPALASHWVRVPASGGDPAEALMGDHIAEDDLRATADELAAGGLRVDWVIGTPPVPRFIIDPAAARDADMIVMATHGRTGLARAFAGSVSEGVVADSGRW